MNAAETDSIQGIRPEHRLHNRAWDYPSWHRTKGGQFYLRAAACCGLHVGAVSLAKWKPHCELRIELRELLQARELVVAACAGAYIKGNAQLVTRGAASLDNETPFLSPHDAWLSCAWSFLTLAHASLLERGAMRGRNCYVAMNLNERLEKVGGRSQERGR
jgi:hypothetical protein